MLAMEAGTALEALIMVISVDHSKGLLPPLKVSHIKMLMLGSLLRHITVVVDVYTKRHVNAYQVFRNGVERSCSWCVCSYCVCLSFCPY